MPVILTTEAEIEQWMTAPPEEALKLQRPLPDGTLRVVMTGEKEDKQVCLRLAGWCCIMFVPPGSG